MARSQGDHFLNIGGGNGSGVGRVEFCPGFTVVLLVPKVLVRFPKELEEVGAELISNPPAFELVDDGPTDVLPLPPNVPPTFNCPTGSANMGLSRTVL